jgi:hypothetical protein
MILVVDVTPRALAVHLPFPSFQPLPDATNPIYRPLSGIGISYGIFFSLLCDFNPELWQVHSTILASFCLILGIGSLNKCYTSETRFHNYGWH